MPITHADIAERMRELGSKAAIGDPARIAKERASLQELCSGLGHQFKQPGWTGTVKPPRVCSVCQAKEG